MSEPSFNNSHFSFTFHQLAPHRSFWFPASFRNSTYDETLQKVEDLTKDLFSKLFPIWSSMYEFTPELREDQLNKFLGYLECYYSTFAFDEEEERIQMLVKIDVALSKLEKLQRDLQLSHEVVQTIVQEPYSKFMQETENSIKKYEEIRDKRLERLKCLRQKEKELCELLELDPLPDLENTIPSENQLEEIDDHLLQLIEEKENQIQFYKETRKKIVTCMRELEHEPENDFEFDVIINPSTSFIPSLTNINKLKDLRTHIERQHDDRFKYRACLLDRLSKLWNCINLEQSEKDDFLFRNASISKATFKALHKEIQRCEEIRRANIKSLMKKVREQISNLWDLLTYTEEQRSQFRVFTTNDFSQEILTLHELEAENLTQRYNKYLHIFQLIKKRNQLWQRMLHLDEMALDENRLHNRGGRLLKEEKERKTLQDLPKVNSSLKAALSQYQTEEGVPFLWHGNNLLELINKEWKNRFSVKKYKKLAKDVEVNRIPRSALKDIGNNV